MYKRNSSFLRQDTKSSLMQQPDINDEESNEPIKTDPIFVLSKTERDSPLHVLPISFKPSPIIVRPAPVDKQFNF